MKYKRYSSIRRKKIFYLFEIPVLVLLSCYYKNVGGEGDILFIFLLVIILHLYMKVTY